MSNPDFPKAEAGFGTSAVSFDPDPNAPGCAVRLENAPNPVAGFAALNPLPKPLDLLSPLLAGVRFPCPNILEPEPKGVVDFLDESSEPPRDIPPKAGVSSAIVSSVVVLDAGIGEAEAMAGAVPNPNPVWPNLAGEALANAPNPVEDVAEPNGDADDGWLNGDVAGDWVKGEVEDA